MGISINILPVMGLGFVLHFDFPGLEFQIGPFAIRIGDKAAIDALDAMERGEDDE